MMSVKWRLLDHGMLATLLALATAGSLFVVQPAVAAGRKPVIALSNAYYGNTWRHQMVEAFNETAEAAKKDGRISDFTVLNGDNTVAQQISQMSDLILKHVAAITIDAASLTALNGVIEKACAAHIVVVAFDSIASAPCAYKLNWNFATWQGPETNWIAKKIGGKGNVMIVRGVKGSAPDQDIYQQQLAVLKKYPEIKIVSTVFGMASTSVAQSAVSNVLPSLPDIAAVIGQGGGDSFGIAQAFEQFGGVYANHMPVIAGDGDASFLHWWMERHKKTGYSTISMNSAPGISQAAFWVALDVLDGEKVPKSMLMSVYTVTDANLAQYANMKPGTIVSPAYTREWVEQHLLSQGH
ncbi:MAG: ABC transporter substrate-binding protein [Acetobacteraceae bacterium]